MKVYIFNDECAYIGSADITSDDEHWKVRLIEQELMKRMFEEV